MAILCEIKKVSNNWSGINFHYLFRIQKNHWPLNSNHNEIQKKCMLKTSWKILVSQKSMQILGLITFLSKQILWQLFWYTEATQYCAHGGLQLLKEAMPSILIHKNENPITQMTLLKNICYGRRNAYIRTLLLKFTMQSVSIFFLYFFSFGQNKVPYGILAETMYALG